MAYLPAFHTGFGPWVYPDAKPVTRYIVVEFGVEGDEITWLTAQPGVSWPTLSPRPVTKSSNGSAPEISHGCQATSPPRTWASSTERHQHRPPCLLGRPITNNTNPHRGNDQ